MKILSLFANIGVSEALLEDTNFKVILANELEEERVEIYKKIYKDVNVIQGDITDSKIKRKIIDQSKESNIDIILATPPCQGMSTAGRMDKEDKRNLLICDTIDIIDEILPRYVLIENVPGMLGTKININNKQVSIKDYIKSRLSEKYYLNYKIVNLSDYNIPQQRERVIFLISRKDQNIWRFPARSKKKITLKDAIGHLPILDPYVSDVNKEELLKLFPNYDKRRREALKISKWHIPPKHVKRQVYVMMRTPTGETAFNNKEEFLPRKINGDIVKGFKNTYKRQSWDKPAYTITMYNRTISSQNNVHPGRYIGMDSNGNKLYSDPRVLTLYELMICMTIPDNWNIPEDVSESKLRSLIGEGLPPKFLKDTLYMLGDKYD